MNWQNGLFFSVRARRLLAQDDSVHQYSKGNVRCEKEKKNHASSCRVLPIYEDIAY
jgi:hypothetical protein